MGLGIFVPGNIILILICIGAVYAGGGNRSPAAGGGNRSLLPGTIWGRCFTIPGMWVIGRFILKKR